MIKWIIGSVLAWTIASCTCVHYIPTGSPYPERPPALVAVHLDAPLALDIVPIGVIRYRAANKTKLIRRVQRLAAVNGGTHVYVIESGRQLPLTTKKGQLVVGRTSRPEEVISLLGTADYAMFFKIGDHVRYKSLKNAGDTALDGIVHKIRKGGVVIITTDITRKRKKVYAYELSILQKK